MKKKKYISAAVFALICFFATTLTAFAEGTEEAVKAPFDVGKSVIIALVIGFIIALIVTLAMKGRLKSVRSRDNARDYIKKDSLNITVRRDTFLYSRVERTPKQRNEPQEKE